MKLKKLLVLLTLVALLVGATGCLFSPDSGGPGDTVDPTLPPATTPDKLMTNFQSIYEGMLYDEFESMLDANYRTVLLQSTFDDWAQGTNPLTLMYFDKDVEIQIHRNMFDGLTGVGPAGETIPPIDSINVNTLDKDGTWEPVEQSMEYFGGFENAFMCRYNVVIHFNNPDQHRYEVDQAVDFIVIRNADGIYHMLGQIGHDNSN